MNKYKREIILEDWNFFNIAIKDKELYDQYIKETIYPTNLWSANFDYLWGVSDPNSELVLWKVVNEMLVTFKLTKRHTLQLACLPFGKGSSEKVTQVLSESMKFCQQWNQRKGGKTLVRVVTKDQLRFLKNSQIFDQGFRYVKLNGVDRHVGVKKLLDLSGGDFKNVRNSINHFLRNHPDALVRRATPEDYDALLNLKEEWNKTSGKKYKKIWDNRIYQNIIRNFQELGHIVLCVELEGKIIGVLTGGVLPHGQAWGSLLKKMEGYYGLSEFLYVQFAHEIHKVDPNVEMINLGIDIGVKGGLRAFKDKFNPVLDSERYRLYLKNK